MKPGKRDPVMVNKPAYKTIKKTGHKTYKNRGWILKNLYTHFTGAIREIFSEQKTAESAIYSNRVVAGQQKYETSGTQDNDWLL